MFSPLAFFRYCFAQSLNCLIFGCSLHSDVTASALLLMLSLAHAVVAGLLAYHPDVQAAPLLPAIPVQDLSQRLRTWYASQSKGRRLLLLAGAAVAVFLLVPPLIRNTVYPGFGAFGPDTLNAYTLGAAQFFLALTLAYSGWRWLFPGLYAYAAETMEGKLLESITADLVALLPGAGQWDTTSALATLAERRRIAIFQFTIRCVRFVFSISPFVFFFLQANAALTAALTAVPQ